MILPPANRWHGRQVTALARLSTAHDALYRLLRRLLAPMLARATERQARLNRRYLAPHWRANVYTREA